MQNFFLCKNPKKRKRRTNFVKKKKWGEFQLWPRYTTGYVLPRYPVGQVHSLAIQTLQMLRCCSVGFVLCAE